MRLHQDQYKTVIEGYEQIKKVRHDMIGHLMALDGYLKKSGKFISSKKNREKEELGTGIGNIEEIVEKYNGAFITELRENIFIVKAIIPNNRYKS